MRPDPTRLRAGLATLLILALPQASLADQPPDSNSLESAIRAFEQLGHRVFYSSDLVRPSMNVDVVPSTTGAVSALGEILKPHGLMLRRGFNDSWLIVRAPRPPDSSPNAPTTAPQPAEVESPDSLPIEEIIVAASRYEIRRSQTAPTRTIRDFELETLPDLGEDAMRAAARLPGMAFNGVSALANVRGGEIGETLVRLDGLRLYDPFHLKDFQGVFSAIDPRIVDSMDIYTGGFPATFGDRMSGVIDVETIPAPDKLYHELGISFFNSSFLSSGNFADSRGEWITSFRRSNLDILYENFSKQPERPRYTDVFAKMGFKINDRLTLTGNLLRVEDDISLSDDIDREERAVATQLDTYGWLKLDQELSGMLSGSTLIARSDIESNRSGATAKSGLSNGSLTDYRSFSIDTVQTEWARVIGARMLLDFGGSVSHAKGSYAYRDEVSYDLLFSIDGAPVTAQRSRSIFVSPETRQTSLFATLRFDWTETLTTEFGLRWSEETNDDRNDNNIGPRLGLRYTLSEKSSVRASWGRFHQPQAINELQVNDGVMSFYAPQRSDHFVLGFDRLVGDGIALRIEAYEKSMHELRPRFENLLNTRVLLPELKPDRIRIAPTSASARGAEISADGEVGNYRWWSALSVARVRDRIEQMDVARSWDQTYALSAGFSWDTSRWNLSTGIVYRSGWPTTRVMLATGAPTPTVDAMGRNSERMRAFGSLDLRVSRKFQLDNSELSVALELANMTNRANPCCVEYEIGDEQDAGLLMLDELNYLPTIPSIGMLWKF